MLNKMNEVLSYIEVHLDGELDLDKKIPQITGETSTQFKKIFLFLADVSLLEYIRKRRLTLAGYDLRERKMKVIEVAVKYGYDSPDSFARAFSAFHQVTPSEVYEKGTEIKSFSPIQFDLTMSGGTPMNYRIEEKPAFKIAGIKKRIPFIIEGRHQDITSIVESLDHSTVEKFGQLENIQPIGGYSAVYNISKEEEETGLHCDYILGTATTMKDTLGLNYISIPKTTWAIFTSEENTRTHIQDIWRKIYTEWLPSSEYTIIDKEPNIFYMENSGLNDPSVRKEIWVQVQKKKQWK